MVYQSQFQFDLNDVSRFMNDEQNAGLRNQRVASWDMIEEGERMLGYDASQDQAGNTEPIKSAEYNL